MCSSDLLLFEGRLGYTLVRSFASRPRLAGIVFNDDFADESFTVYDHPKVLIFRNTGRYPAERIERLLRAVPKRDWWPVLDAALAADETKPPWGGAEPGPTPPDAAAARRGAWALVAWLLAAEALGLIALPLAASLLGGLRDRGGAFAKTLGIALVGWIVWFSSSLRIAPFSLASILLACGLVLLASLALAARGCGWRRFSGGAGRAALASEAVFLASFLLFTS
mgnify:CR=1 FL=1